MDKISKKNQMIDKRIKLLRSKFIQHKIDGYVIPKNDQFFSEYAVEDRLKIISNFSGSAGLAIVLKKKNYLSFKKKSIKYNPATTKIHQNINSACIKHSPKFLQEWRFDNLC